jgi:hypothetical protein
MPSNSKAKEVFGKIKDKLDGKKKIDIPTDLIEIGEFTSSESRTEFFTSLISKLKGFKLDNVTSVKVEPIKKDFGDDELDLEDDQNKEQAKQDALALVKNVALKGEILLASEEYQSLLKKGFFITAIIWRSKQTSIPYSIVEFEAAFDEPGEGRGFKYSVRGALNFAEGEYTKTLRPIVAEEREGLLSLIEQTASAAIAEIRKRLAKESVEEVKVEGVMQ